MSVHGEVVINLLGALMLGYVVLLTVRGRLSERWCLLWIAAVAAAVALVDVPGLLAFVTAVSGATYPASALTMVSLVLLLLLAVRGGSEATMNSQQVLALTQQLALLRQQLDEHRAEEDRAAAALGQATQKP